MVSIILLFRHSIRHFVRNSSDMICRINLVRSLPCQRAKTLNTWLMRLVQEFVHGRNRRKAHLGTQWANFIAQCFNQEGSRTQALQHRALSLLRPEQRLRATSCAESEMGIAKRRRKKNLYDIVRDNEIDHRKSLGHKVIIADSDFIKIVRAQVLQINKSPA